MLVLVLVLVLVLIKEFEYEHENEHENENEYENEYENEGNFAGWQRSPSPGYAVRRRVGNYQPNREPEQS